jgi:ParB/RepB/Spo0J family partition protein
MHVAVSLIDTNPYRHIDKYPINREKVEALKTSINQTGFWDNILLRPSGDRYQLAYGHHRLTAIKELELDMVDVPVRELDDATMLRIMANENMDEWKASPAVINETVYAAKEFIDSELAKYETWEEAIKKADIFISLFCGQLDKDGKEKNPKALFGQAKGQGAGQTTILAFLGGNWKQWMIQEGHKKTPAHYRPGFSCRILLLSKNRYPDFCRWLALPTWLLHQLACSWVHPYRLGACCYSSAVH